MKRIEKVLWLILTVALGFVMEGCGKADYRAVKKTDRMKYSKSYTPGASTKLRKGVGYFWESEKGLDPGAYIEFREDGLFMRNGIVTGIYKATEDSIVVQCYSVSKQLWVHCIDIWNIHFHLVGDSVLTAKSIRYNIREYNPDNIDWANAREIKYIYRPFPYPFKLFSGNYLYKDMRDIDWFWEDKQEYKAWKEQQKRK